MDFRPAVFIVGLLLATLAVVMCLPAIADFAYGHPDWQVFATAACTTFFVGVTMALTSKVRGLKLTIRHAFMITTASWASMTLFASLPFVFSELDMNFTDAMFEAMSGITTTGSTVIVGLENAPPGILLWRALLQWLGGIGIIVMGIAVLPLLQVGGMQLFRMESSDQSDKAMPRAAQIASAIGVIYFALTILWTGFYWLAGMSGFDAVVHSMTTIATGGFSSHDASIAYFESALIDYIATAGMLVGALPFVLYLRTLQGEMTALFNDSQVQWFIVFVSCVIVVTAGWLVFEIGEQPLEALRLSAFNIVSVITGTGYATDDFGLWGAFSPVMFFFIMFIGGCAAAWGFHPVLQQAPGFRRDHYLGAVVLFHVVLYVRPADPWSQPARSGLHHRVLKRRDFHRQRGPGPGPDRRTGGEFLKLPRCREMADGAWHADGAAGTVHRDRAVQPQFLAAVIR